MPLLINLRILKNQTKIALYKYQLPSLVLSLYEDKHNPSIDFFEPRDDRHTKMLLVYFV